MKAAASLTGSLLARKGAAYPASYSAPAGQSDSDGEGAPAQRAYNDPRVIASAPPPPAPAADQGPQMQDGRMVEDVETPAKKQPLVPPPVADAPASEAPAADWEAALPQAMDNMGRVRLSVRLDPDRYLRVKMASARTRWSAQDIVIAALDKFLTEAHKGNGGADPSDGGDTE